LLKAFAKLGPGAGCSSQHISSAGSTRGGGQNARALHLTTSVQICMSQFRSAHPAVKRICSIQVRVFAQFMSVHHQPWPWFPPRESAIVHQRGKGASPRAPPRAMAASEYGAKILSYDEAVQKARAVRWGTFVNVEQIAKAIVKFYADVFVVQPLGSTEKLYVDPCSFIAAQFAEMGLDVAKGHLDTLEQEVSRAADDALRARGHPRPVRNACLTVPAHPAAGCTSKHLVQLHHFGFQEDAFIRGAPVTCDVLDVIITSLCSDRGLETDKYNVEVLFELRGAAAGQPMLPFATGVSVGSATVMSCYLLAFAILELDLQHAVLEDLWSEMCIKIAKCFWLHADYDPGADLTNQVYQSISSKCAAAARQRPNIIQMNYAFRRTTAAVMAGSGCRRAGQHNCQATAATSAQPHN
jgi:hypothetical protein